MEVDDGILVHFTESVPMSTYLTCFIVSDFSYTGDTLMNGQEFRVYATPEQVSKTEYARQIGKSVIEYFIDYFDIDFPLPKLGKNLQRNELIKSVLDFNYVGNTI